MMDGRMGQALGGVISQILGRKAIYGCQWLLIAMETFPWASLGDVRLCNANWQGQAELLHSLSAELDISVLLN